MKYKIISLGCKVNSYECSALASSLKSRGFIECEKETPDVVIINTCSVTATADQKSRQHIRKFKTLYPNAIIAVMGCYCQGNYEYVANEINADIIVGTSHRNEIPDLIDEYVANKKQQSTYADVIVRLRNGNVEIDFRSLGEVFDPMADEEGDIIENVKMLRSVASSIQNEYVLGMNSVRITIEGHKEKDTD